MQRFEEYTDYQNTMRQPFSNAMAPFIEIEEEQAILEEAAQQAL